MNLAPKRISERLTRTGTLAEATAGCQAGPPGAPDADPRPRAGSTGPDRTNRCVRVIAVAACLSLSMGTHSPLHSSAAAPAHGTAPIEAAVLSAVADGERATFLLRLAKAGSPVGPKGSEGPIAGTSPSTSPYDRESARARVLSGLRGAGQARIQRVEPTLSMLEASGHVTHIERFPLVGAIALVGDAAAVARLAETPGVAEVIADRERRLIDGPNAHAEAEPTSARTDAGDRWNLAAVGAPLAWSLGVTGQGAVVATIDTGADWTHPALRHSYRGRDGNHEYDWIDVTRSGPASPRPVDPHGHGTHIVGLISGGLGPETLGVAPGAEWLAVRAFDEGGHTRDLWLLRAAEWVLAPTDLDGANPRFHLAPDVVNCSWVLENTADPLFADIVEAWRRAGIVPVFAAGNDDDGTGTWASARAPGSHSEALSVGALTPNGTVWALSRGGPGFYGGVKPDLTAPGVDIVSAAPGGGLTRYDGTSMAAAHVSGAAALLVSAAPHLTVDDVVALLRTTAQDAGLEGPDDRYGYGKLDSHAAVSLAMTAGRVAGLLADSAGEPVPGAVMTARQSGNPVTWTAISNADGTFDLAVPSGRWGLTAEAFGYRSGAFYGVIEDDRTLGLDLELHAAPTSELTGEVVSSAAGQPLQADLFVVGESVFSSSTPDGKYSLKLPEGEHTLRIEAPEHRAVTLTLSATPPTGIERNLELPAQGRILVVDADAWAQERIYPYVADVLAAAGYSYDVYPIDDLTRLPSGADLELYDIAIWIHLYGSPGTINFRRGDSIATDTLSEYVAAGGSLLITGQDIGFLDSAEGPVSMRRAPQFYREVLGARFETTDAFARTAFGVGPLEGVRLDLDWPTGRVKGRRLAPDSIQAFSGPGPGHTSPVIRYTQTQVGGLGTAGELGRRIYFAFGPESVGGPTALAKLLDRSIAWLEPPLLAFDGADSLAAPGAAVPFTATLRAGRSMAFVRLELTAGRPLDLERGTGGLASDGAGGWEWSGELGAGDAKSFTVEARLAGPAHGTDLLPVTAVLKSAERNVTETVSVSPLTPDLRASQLTMTPGRSTEGGESFVTLGLVNGGHTAADASARLQLPEGLEAFTDTLHATDGTAAWGPAAGQITWGGQIAPSDSVTVSVAGELPKVRSESFVVSADIADGVGNRITRRASALVGGPELRQSSIVPEAASVVAGSVVTMALQLRNNGSVAAGVEAVADLPDDVQPGPSSDWSYDEAADQMRWLGEVEAMGATDVALPLAAAADARGERALSVTLLDGEEPTNPVVLAARILVDGADLSGSKASLLPARARSGDTLTGTLLLGNHGNTIARTSVTDALPSVLVVEPGSLLSSAGTVSPAPGAVQWSVSVAPPVGGYTWTTTSLAVNRPAIAQGPAPWAPYLVPIELDMLFPFFTEAYTTAWATRDGLLAFGNVDGLDPVPDDSPETWRLDELMPPSVAVLWRPDTDLGDPRAYRSDGRQVVEWSGQSPDSYVRVELEQNGNLRLGYGPAAEIGDALIGLHSGTDWEPRIPAEEVHPGGGLAIKSPGGWEWLRYRARLGLALAPNSSVSRTATVVSGGITRTLGASVLANALRLSGSRLDLAPSTPVSGGLIGGRLTLLAEGMVDAKNVVATIRLPDSAELLTDGSTDGLLVDPDAGEITWEGRVTLDTPVGITWRARLGADAPVGLDFLTQARVSAAGLEPINLMRRQVVGATDFSGSKKLAQRAVSMPGEVVTFTLYVANAGQSKAEVTVTDALPPGLEIVPGALISSARPAPEWDPTTRSMRWLGTVAAGGAIQIEMGTRYVGPGRVTNIMHLDDQRGTSFAAWSDVIEGVDQAFLPTVGR